MKNLGMAILAQMAKALEVKTEEITEIFEDGFQSMRMNYYPPCPQPDKVIGLTPHSDASGITILLQVNEVEGLQIKKDGKWVSIKPLPNAFVINIGDSLEVFLTIPIFDFFFLGLIVPFLLNLLPMHMHSRL